VVIVVELGDPDLRLKLTWVIKRVDILFAMV
jgi:hypothetical protein